MTNDHIRVYLSLNRQESNVDLLVTKLCSSMSLYGKVLQIKMLSRDGFFEGEVSVVLQRKASDSDFYKPLQRMLFLEEWDVLVPARYTGADKICYFCRKSGHMKNDCPVLKEIICRRCQRTGHTQRRCTTIIEDERRMESTFEEEYNMYMRLSQPTMDSNLDSPSSGVDQPTNFEEPAAQETMPTDSQLLEVMTNNMDDEDDYSGDDSMTENREGSITAVESSKLPNTRSTKLIPSHLSSTRLSKFASTTTQTLSKAKVAAKVAKKISATATATRKRRQPITYVDSDIEDAHTKDTSVDIDMDTAHDNISEVVTSIESPHSAPDNSAREGHEYSTYSHRIFKCS